MDPIPYFLAIGRDGSLFFLNGFAQSDFDKLYKVKIKSVQDSVEARDLAFLYMKTSAYSACEREIIDDVNFTKEKYELPTEDISQPMVEKNGNSYSVIFYSIHKLNFCYGAKDKLVMHKFEMGDDGTFKYQEKTIGDVRKL